MISTLMTSECDSNKFKLSSHYIHLTLFCLRFWYSFSCSTWVCSTVSCSTSFCLYFAHLALLMFYSTSSSALLKFVHSILFCSTPFNSVLLTFFQSPTSLVLSYKWISKYYWPKSTFFAGKWSHLVKYRTTDDDWKIQYSNKIHNTATNKNKIW